MLVNPNRVRLPTIPGTRILTDSLDVVGFQYMDPRDPGRLWVLQCLYAPIERRRIGGIRAKFMDDKYYTSFCNQRDLEVMIGIAKPGSRCHWAGIDYSEVGDSGWFGLCIDQEDLDDDLLERELRCRESYPGIMPSHLQMYRRLHDDGADSEELLMLLNDWDPATGFGPDTRLETINQRWVRVERNSLPWAQADI